MLERHGAADLIYAPDIEEIYPPGFATKLVVEGPAAGLESDFRPHFFSGVATAVAKLFLQTGRTSRCSARRIISNCSS